MDRPGAPKYPVDTLSAPGHPSFVELGLPVFYALFLWWFSTGLVLYLDGLPRRTFRTSLLGATVLALLALAGLGWSRSETTVAGAFVAFTCALVVWGWNEMAFLLGFVTGSRRAPCPEGCAGLRHFGHGAQAVLHHELALAASGLVVFAIAGTAPNPVGAWTFVALWAMRLSTKLNVFLGVPNLSEGFLPDHLRYLASFFRRRPMNLLFPVSVTAATSVTALVVARALAPEAGAYEVAAHALLAALLALGVLEHWFLVLPLPSEALFGWGLRSRAKPPSAGLRGLRGGGDDAGAPVEQELSERGRDG